MSWSDTLALVILLALVAIGHAWGLGRGGGPREI